MLLQNPFTNFLKQMRGSSINSFNTISTNNLDLASKQLWKILSHKIQYLQASDQSIVELAFTQMVIAHGQMRRKSGQFYIIHPVAACITLAEIGMDKDALAACLLHDVPEDTEISLQDLAKDFSPEVVFLVEGITKLSVIKYKGEDRYAENLRRMFVAMSKDLRVIFIKLADRLHNLQTLKHVKAEKQYRIALESLEIYAPIAERLGISFFRGEIEDAAFQYVFPEKYKEVISISELEIRRRTKIVDKIIKKTEGILKKESIPYIQLVGRAKKYYSIFRKVNVKGRSLDQIYDLVALRIVTDTVENCYAILAILHKYFEVKSGRTKDYIAKPKLNGYRSIHVVATDPQNGHTFEFQVRTQSMHDYAEYGVAAHWSYKQKGKYENFLDKENLKWISELLDLGKQNLTQEEYLKHVKLDLFPDRIFVMTPKNDVIDLPKGATALDFAYKIHTHLGHQASLAKVNGEAVKLNEKLTNGCVVEILADKRKEPNRDYLQWVITRIATKSIKRYLKQKN